MASDLQQTLDRISRKAENLTDRYRVAVEENKAAKARIGQLQSTVSELQRQIDVMQRKIEYLTVVSTAVASREDIERSRATLSKLVREIDKCIAELSE